MLRVFLESPKTSAPFQGRHEERCALEKLSAREVIALYSRPGLIGSKRRPYEAFSQIGSPRIRPSSNFIADGNPSTLAAVGIVVKVKLADVTT